MKASPRASIPSLPGKIYSRSSRQSEQGQMQPEGGSGINLMTAELRVQLCGPSICMAPSAAPSADSNNPQRRQEFSGHDACVVLEPRVDRFH